MPARSAGTRSRSREVTAGTAWRGALADLGAAGELTRAHRPQSDGKVAGFHRTLLDAWAYLRPCTSNTERTAAH
ncbi:hypothetical protein AQJ64_18455, partial [Streptomyces griseoruber]